MYTLSTASVLLKILKNQLLIGVEDLCLRRGLYSVKVKETKSWSVSVNVHQSLMTLRNCTAFVVMWFFCVVL